MMELFLFASGWFARELRPVYSLTGEPLLEGFPVFVLQETDLSEGGGNSSLVKVPIIDDIFYQFGISVKGRKFSSNVELGDGIKVRLSPFTCNTLLTSGGYFSMKYSVFGFSTFFERTTQPEESDIYYWCYINSPITTVRENLFGAKIEFDFNYIKPYLSWSSKILSDGSFNNISSWLEGDVDFSAFLYIRVGDSNPSDGFGGQIGHIKVTFLPSCESIEFDTNGADSTEALYYLGGGNLGTIGRFADREDKILYKIPIPENQTDLLLYLYTGGRDRLVEISYDGTNWVEIPASLLDEMNNTGSTISLTSDMGMSLSQAYNVVENVATHLVEIGFSFRGLWGLDIQGQYFTFKQRNKIAGGGDEWLSDKGFRAWISKDFLLPKFKIFGKGILPLLRIEGEYLCIPSDYPQSPFFIDNDDADRFPDCSDEDGVWPGLDGNKDGAPDFYQPFFGSYFSPMSAYDPFTDANFNFVADSFEDDSRADLPDSPGTKKARANIEADFKGLDLSVVGFGLFKDVSGDTFYNVGFLLTKIFYLNLLRLTVSGRFSKLYDYLSEPVASILWDGFYDPFSSISSTEILFGVVSSLNRFPLDAVLHFYYQIFPNASINRYILNASFSKKISLNDDIFLKPGFSLFIHQFFGLRDYFETASVIRPFYIARNFSLPIVLKPTSSFSSILSFTWGDNPEYGEFKGVAFQTNAGGSIYGHPLLGQLLVRYLINNEFIIKITFYIGG